MLGRFLNLDNAQGLGREFEVRGEFIVTKGEFERSNQLIQESGARAAYSNPRNLACGIIGRIHTGKHTPVKLNFKAYTLISYDSPKPPGTNFCQSATPKLSKYVCFL